MKLSAEDAYKLLVKDVVSTPDDFLEDKNRWVKHCLFVGVAAGRIAEKIGVDDDFAEACGFIHDIGRKISHEYHVVDGYYYLKKKGYDEMARYCLTHSYIDNDVQLTAGGPVKLETAKVVVPYLEDKPANIYDNIIQLCDLFCSEEGFTTIEKRLLDITNRKGIYSNSYEHFRSVLDLKQKIECMMGCDLYSLFPEISHDDLKNIPSDYLQLKNLLTKPVVKKGEFSK